MLPMMPMPSFGQTVIPYNLGDHTNTIPESLAFMVAGLLQKIRTVEEEKAKLQGVINSHEATIRGLRERENTLSGELHTAREANRESLARKKGK